MAQCQIFMAQTALVHRLLSENHISYSYTWRVHQFPTTMWYQVLHQIWALSTEHCTKFQRIYGDSTRFLDGLKHFQKEERIEDKEKIEDESRNGRPS